jgi:hypothetical protein
MTSNNSETGQELWMPVDAVLSFKIKLGLDFEFFVKLRLKKLF